MVINSPGLNLYTFCTFYLILDKSTSLNFVFLHEQNGYENFLAGMRSKVWGQMFKQWKLLLTNTNQNRHYFKKVHFSMNILFFIEFFIYVGFYFPIILETMWE